MIDYFALNVLVVAKLVLEKNTEKKLALSRK